MRTIVVPKTVTANIVTAPRSGPNSFIVSRSPLPGAPVLTFLSASLMPMAHLRQQTSACIAADNGYRLLGRDRILAAHNFGSALRSRPGHAVRPLPGAPLDTPAASCPAPARRLGAAAEPHPRLRFRDCRAPAGPRPDTRRAWWA